MVDVALKGKGIAGALFPVRAEPGLAHSPIVKVPAVGMELGTTGEAHAVDTVIETPTVPAPVAEGAGTLLNIAASQRTASTRAYLWRSW